MKRSKKITIGIIIFFVVITLIIIGRYAIGLHFKKKFSKRPPPGVIVEVVANKNFSQSLESYCTSLSSKTISYKIKKNELLEPIKFDVKVNWFQQFILFYFVRRSFATKRSAVTF